MTVATAFMSAVVSLCNTLGGSVLRCSSCSSVINQCLKLLSRTPWLRTMNARRRMGLSLNRFSYMERNSSRCLNTYLHILENLLHWLHCTLPDLLHHPQYGGARSMGAGYSSPSGCNSRRTVWPSHGCTRRHGNGGGTCSSTYILCISVCSKYMSLTPLAGMVR